MITGGTGAAATAVGGRRSPVPWCTRPGPVLVAVLGVWTAVPTLVAPPKLTWALTAALLALVANALWWHARAVGPSAPVVLLAVVLTCGVLSSVHHGSLLSLTVSAATALLVVGCASLAAHCDADDVRPLVRGVVVVALAQTAVALAVLLLGLPAPWEQPGDTGTNPLLPGLGERLSGTMAHPLPFAALAAVAAALCATRLSAWPPAVRIAAAAGCCTGVALSGSRSAVLALCAAVVVTVLLPGVARIGPVARTVAVLVLVAAALRVDASRLTVVSSLQGTGSLTHRLAAWEAAGRLSGRPAAEVLFGSGAGSLPDLFRAGFLQLDGFFAVDNQLVATYAVAGLTGVLALVIAVAAGLWRGDRASRPAALLLVLMFGSFDVLEWTATTVLVAVLVCLGTGRRPGDDAVAPGPAPDPTRCT
ncbi:hypothetical protein ACI796_21855 [Geodermatophilus sp. SYSU D00525]